MRLLVPLAVLACLLAPALPVPGEVASAPGWRVGDRWTYDLNVTFPAGEYRGNVTVEVSSAGSVKVGNSTVKTYTLSLHRQERGLGFNFTTTGRAIVARSDLCTLSSSTVRVTQHGTLRTEARRNAAYSPSDGRHRFPLAAGTSWTASYNLSLRSVAGSQLVEESSSVNLSCLCEAEEGLTVPAGKFTAYRVRLLPPQGGNTSLYWFSKKAGWEIKSQEWDDTTDTLTTMELRKRSRVEEPAPFSGPEAERALFLLEIAAAVIIVASSIQAFASWRRRKALGPERPPAGPAKKAPPRGAGPAPERGGITLQCPACRERFIAPAGTRSVKCPRCGKEGSAG